MKIKGTENSSFVLSNIGEDIKTSRIDKMLSQKELAQISGVSFSTVTRIEKGESVSLDNFIKILKGLDCAENLNLLIPEKTKDAKQVWLAEKKRKRVSHKQKKEYENVEWEWEDKE